MSVNEKMTAIADAIRDRTGGTEKMGLDQMAAGVEQVYVSGKQAQEDAFWDAVQANGTRYNYNRGFCGYTWTDENFKPRYDIRPTAYSGFYNCFAWSSVTDLVGILERQGVTLDTSGCSGDMGGAFSNSAITNVPVIDATKADTIAHLFAYCSALKRVEGLIVSPSTAFSYAFAFCTALEHVLFGGTVGQNGLDLKECTKLDKASIESIVNALSATTSGLSITLSKTAVDNAFYDADGEGSIGSESLEWSSLINTKSNWTISLV